jgi:hypothetical protein
VDDLPVNEHSVIKFSRSLLASGAPAWQRWQAVRAVECYRDFVLKKTAPDLSGIIATLAKLGRRERNINRGEPELIQTMRGELRVLHYSMSTERAYVRWVKRFSGIPFKLAFLLRQQLLSTNVLVTSGAICLWFLGASR